VIVLPGSKHVFADLAWLRDRELDRAIRRVIDLGVRVVGVCGGAMMVGDRIADPHGVEGGGERHGLELIRLTTEMAASKATTATRVRFGPLAEPWSALSAVAADGYEIRYGVVSGSARAVAEGVGVAGNVRATTGHGLFEDPAVVDALVGVRPTPVLDPTFDLLADAIDEHLDTELLGRVVGLA